MAFERVHAESSSRSATTQRPETSQTGQKERNQETEGIRILWWNRDLRWVRAKTNSASKCDSSSVSERSEDKRGKPGPRSGNVKNARKGRKEKCVRIETGEWARKMKTGAAGVLAIDQFLI